MLELISIVMIMAPVILLFIMVGKHTSGLEAYHGV
nr:MAG TPA: hypothetical protein [Microviridae sp.]